MAHRMRVNTDRERLKKSFNRLVHKNNISVFRTVRSMHIPSLRFHAQMLWITVLIRSSPPSSSFFITPNNSWKSKTHSSKNEKNTQSTEEFEQYKSIWWLLGAYYSVCTSHFPTANANYDCMQEATILSCLDNTPPWDKRRHTGARVVSGIGLPCLTLQWYHCYTRFHNSRPHSVAKAALFRDVRVSVCVRFVSSLSLSSLQ